MRRTILVWSVLFCAALLVGCRSEALGELGVGHKVGKLVLKDSKNKSVDFSKLKGVYVVAFFIPGDKDSRDKLNQLKAIVGKPKFKGVKALIVTRGKDKKEQAAAKNDLKKNKWPFTLVFDPKLKGADYFSVGQPLPVFMVISKGRLALTDVRALRTRIRNYTFEDMLARIMDGKSIPLVEFVPMDRAEDRDSIALLGKAPPAFSLKAMNGVTLKPNMYKGSKNVILIFWSPSCPHCRRELPKIRKFMTTYGEQYDVAIITLVFKFDKDTEGQIRGAMRDLTIDFPTIMYTDKTLADKYNAHSVPTIYIINKNGVIVDFLRGETEKTQGVLKSIFDDKERMNRK